MGGVLDAFRAPQAWTPSPGLNPQPLLPLWLQIAIFIKRGPNKELYEIKPEYRDGSRPAET